MYFFILWKLYKKIMLISVHGRRISMTGLNYWITVTITCAIRTDSPLADFVMCSLWSVALGLIISLMLFQTTPVTDIVLEVDFSLQCGLRGAFPPFSFLMSFLSAWHVAFLNRQSLFLYAGSTVRWLLWCNG
jgi:hypothetical protein